MKLNNLINSSEEINMLRELNVCSHKMGQNKNLVQGPGGNTSIKIGRKLFIKASGKRLDNALNENIFIPLCLENVLDSFDNHNKSRQNLELKPLIETDLKPSIETFFHALMPFKVVLHTHPLDIIAITSMDNFRQNFEFILKDIEWDLISYQRPGYPLAESIKESLSNQKSNVLFLANHGLIVGGDNPIEAEKVQNNIINDLKIKSREIIPPNVEVLNKLQNNFENINLPASNIIHTLGVDPFSFELSHRSPHSPDQAVFCNLNPLIIDNLNQDWDHLSKVNDYAIIKDIGVIYLKKSNLLLESMLLAQASIFLKIPEGENVNVLSNEECKSLINWEAEKYRKSLIQS